MPDRRGTSVGGRDIPLLSFVKTEPVGLGRQPSRPPRPGDARKRLRSFTETADRASRHSAS
ncbi:hypothetical protein KL86PLE_40612 [uncultured Pleomorphomonas sp.]|uniref:Uncharacterized protein n=1 Tax=uncultured Pleomorphomonas sp. TaxID=442121 RepID=A0A212LAA2_9HYPH|nr:hypothetical protein KL86PLE_130237 [uncultured Pleomorphomonas sp.]SCM76807.1 hypothetical protein KL86PLE_40612 [uncultured Pleomorphomonas sp.]